MVDYIDASRKIGFLKSLVIFYFAINVLLLCVLNWVFNIVFLGSVFFVVLALITGNVAHKEVRRSHVLRRRVIFILMADTLLSILSVFFSPLFFIAKLIIFFIFFGIILNHDVVISE